MSLPSLNKVITYLLTIQASCMKLENSSSVKCICHVGIKEDPNGIRGKRITMSVKQKPNSQASEKNNYYKGGQSLNIC